MKYSLGFDYISFLKEDLYLFLSFLKSHHIPLYHLQINNDLCTCYIPIHHRFLLKKFKCYYHINKSIGLLSYFLLFFKKIERVIFIISFCIFLFIYSQIIFVIHIDGLDISLNNQIFNSINKQSIQCFTFQPDYQSLNDLLLYLKDQYKDQIEYLNIYKRGSSFHVQYIKRNQINKNQSSYKPIYASKNGIIKSINVTEGLIKIKVNDYVSKGDLLVDNNIISTNNQIKFIPVKGNIYAYTFKTLEATGAYNRNHKVEILYRLLFEIRKQIPLNAIIDKENVLQIEVKHSRIRLVMHYTLIEDITLIGDNNEGNN